MAAHTASKSAPRGTRGACLLLPTGLGVWVSPPKGAFSTRFSATKFRLPHPFQKGRFPNPTTELLQFRCLFKMTLGTSNASAKVWIPRLPARTSESLRKGTTRQGQSTPGLGSPPEGTRRETQLPSGAVAPASPGARAAGRTCWAAPSVASILRSFSCRCSRASTP